MTKEALFFHVYLEKSLKAWLEILSLIFGSLNFWIELTQDVISSHLTNIELLSLRISLITGKSEAMIDFLCAIYSNNFKGDVKFVIRKKSNDIEGNCYQSFTLENGDELDILTTNKSVYGYLAVSGEFDLDYQWSSCSVNTKANIGANNGKKIEDAQKIYEHAW